MVHQKNIIIVDDSSISQFYLSSLFKEHQLNIVDQIESISAIHSKQYLQQPDFICLDYQLNPGTGVDAFPILKTHFPRAQFLFVTSCLSIYSLLEMFELGTCGIAYKESRQSIQNLLYAAQQHKRYYDPVIADKILQFHLESKALTENEKLTFIKLMAGESVPELAEKLNVNDRTIWRRRNDIINKIGRGTFDRYCTEVAI